MIPLIKNFQATTIFKAFILNALATSVIAACAIEVRVRLINEKNTLYIFLNKFIPGKNLDSTGIFIISFLTAFISSIIIYNLLYLIFEYGGGMISSKSTTYYN